MRNYDEVTAELVVQGIRPVSGEFCDFTNSPFEMHFADFFQFGQHFLDRDYASFNIHSARMYFNTNTTVNAVARKIAGYSLVEICQGTIPGLIRLFASNDLKFNDPSLIAYRNLTESRGHMPGPLMFQILLQYFFYHEVGHLVQYTATAPMLCREWSFLKPVNYMRPT